MHHTEKDARKNSRFRRLAIPGSDDCKLEGNISITQIHAPTTQTKPVSSDDLLHAIERAISHHEAARCLKSKLDVVRAHISKLTPREREVFELVVRGKTNKQIGNTLGATERTIKAHRQRVMEKMQVQSLAELVSLAERAGILDAVSGNGQSA